MEKYIKMMTKMEWTKICDFDEIKFDFYWKEKNHNKFEECIIIKITWEKYF